jgi:hypothetical protein
MSFVAPSDAQTSTVPNAEPAPVEPARERPLTAREKEKERLLLEAQERAAARAAKKAKQAAEKKKHDIPVIVWNTDKSGSETTAAEPAAPRPEPATPPAPPPEKSLAEKRASLPPSAIPVERIPQASTAPETHVETAPEKPAAPPPPTRPETEPSEEPEISTAVETTATSPTAPKPQRPRPLRAPGSAGLSITAGAGALLASGGVPGYYPTLAYGGQLTWNPAVMGDFAFDVSFWHSSRTTGAGFAAITDAENDATGGLMYIPRFGPGLYAGFGLGVLVTITSVQYNLTGVSELQGSATSAPRVGGDGTVSFGYRVSYFEARLELHTLLRGGLRLQFLPTANVGVTF